MKIEHGYLVDDTSRGTLDAEALKKSETLKEYVWYEGLTTPKEFQYVYDSNNNKVYFDGNKPFYLNSRKVKTYLSDLLNSAIFKKIVISTNGEAIYQALNNGKAGEGNVIYGKLYKDTNGTPYSGSLNYDIKKDFSASNYYYEAKAFSKWVYTNLANLKIGDIQINEDDLGQIYTDVTDLKGLFGDPNQRIFSRGKNPEDETSAFSKHRNEVIKQSIITNLNQAITSYSGNSEGNYQLPVLTDTDWDQILRNVSIVTFVQGIPIGFKNYNNYVVATSTANKEYVNPDEIYLSDTTKSDKYYHRPYCSQLKSTNLIGYRNIDYVIKSKEGGRDKEDSKYFYRQSIASFTPKQACYYCIVQRDLFNSIEDKDIKTVHKQAYEIALARERYVSHKFK